jgi:hypothetical protein
VITTAAPGPRRPGWLSVSAAARRRRPLRSGIALPVLRALFRTRTGDPFLTMALKTQHIQWFRACQVLSGAVTCPHICGVRDTFRDTGPEAWTSLSWSIGSQARTALSSPGWSEGHARRADGQFRGVRNLDAAGVGAGRPDRPSAGEGYGAPRATVGITDAYRYSRLRPLRAAGVGGGRRVRRTRSGRQQGPRTRRRADRRSACGRPESREATAKSSRSSSTTPGFRSS